MPKTITSVSTGNHQPLFGSFYIRVLKFSLQIPCKFSLFSFSLNKCARLSGTGFTLYIYLHVLEWKKRVDDDVQIVLPQAGPEMHPLHLALMAFLSQFARKKPKVQFNQWPRESINEVCKRGELESQAFSSLILLFECQKHFEARLLLKAPRWKVWLGALVLPDTNVFQHNLQIRYQSIFPSERKMAWQVLLELQTQSDAALKRLSKRLNYSVLIGWRIYREDEMARNKRCQGQKLS